VKCVSLYIALFSSMSIAIPSLTLLPLFSFSSFPGKQYKAGYDLFEKVSSDTTSPTRKTRSAHSERLQNWNASMMNPPSAPPRKKPKSRRSSFATPSTDAIWDIISSAKGKSLKGKSVANDDDGRGGDSDELPWVDRGASVKKKGKERATEASLDDDSTISGYLADSSRAVGHREDFSTLRPGKRRMTDPQSADGPLPSPRKRRKTDGGERIPIRANGHSGHHDVQSLSISQAGPSAVKPPTRSSARLTSLVRLLLLLLFCSLSLTLSLFCILLESQ